MKKYLHFTLLLSLLFTVNNCLAQSQKIGLNKLDDNSTSEIQKMLQYYDKQIYFTENKGQWPANVLYKADFPLGQAIATKQGMMVGTFDQASIAARDAEDIKEEEAAKIGKHYTPTGGVIKGHSWLMNFVNSSSSMSIESKSAHPDFFNYVRGDASNSAMHVNNYQEIWYNDVYKHVDVRYYPSVDGTLEYDIVCKPGFDKRNIILQLDGIDQISINKKGHLVLKTSVGDVDFPAPVAYQRINGRKTSVPAMYKVINENALTFELGKYDEAQPLIIDPIALRWATWITNNSSSVNHGHCIWIDPATNYIYIAGKIAQGTLLGATGAFQSSYVGAGGTDMYFGKYTEPSSIGGPGTRVWQTYYGGGNNSSGTNNGSPGDNPYAMQQGPDGNLYVVGYTSSPNFPLAGGTAFKNEGDSINDLSQITGGNFKIAIIKFDTTGTSFKSSIIGGNGNDQPYDLRITADGSIIVCGVTTSTNLATLFPGTGASNTNNGGNDALVFQINSDLSAISWIKNYGGSGDDQANIMLTNPSNGDIFVAGQTTSSNFPTTNPRQSALVGSQDGFIQKLSSTGATKWSSYFNSSKKNTTAILCMEFNTTENSIYFGGITTGLFSSSGSSTTSISSSGVYQKTYGSGDHDFFVVKMDTSQNFDMATYLGGSSDEVNMMGLNVDLNNDVYIFGYSNSTNFPVTTDALQSKLNTTGSGTNHDKTFTKLRSDLDSLEYSTYYGGTQDDYDPVGERGIKFSNCRIYTIVTSESNDIPLTKGALTTTKTSGSSVYEPGLVVWANPPDLLGNTISGNQTVCAGTTPLGFTGSLPSYSLDSISRNNVISAYPVNYGSAASYQWQLSTDSMNWTNIAGGTTQNLAAGLIGPIYQTTYYRRIIGGDACVLAGPSGQTVTVKILGITAVVNNVTCYGLGNGSITANAVNGTSPYKYLWTGGATAQSISNLSPGAYKVVVTDAVGCKDSVTYAISQPLAPLSATKSSTPATCGNSNGTVGVVPSGGTTPYTYLWSPGGATTSAVSNLSAATYTVSITDSNECSITILDTIANSNGPNANAGPDGVINCITGSQITLSGSSTTSGVTFGWATSGGGNIVSGANTATPVVNAAGTYTVTVTKISNGCTATDVAIVTVDTASPVVNITPEGPVSFCMGGSVQLCAGGAPNYVWSVGSQTATCITVNGTATYSVVGTAANGCTGSASIGVTVNPTYNNSPISAFTCDNQPYTLPWGGTGVAGANVHTYKTVNNCDSVVTINLTINPTYNNSPITASTCDNQPYTLPWGGTGVAGANVHTYKTVNNCDSTVTINLTINPTYNNSPIAVSTCDNQPYTLPWGGTGVAGANVHTYKTVNNCDSVVTINLTINPTYNNSPIAASTCDNQPYILPWGGTGVAGANVHIYKTVNNCDSVVTINLTINPTYNNSPIAASTCDNQPYTLPWGGTGVAGANVHTYTSVSNCDSVVTINLTINPTYNNSPIAASTCDNQPYTLPWGGTGVAGANVHTYKTVSNCDSIVTINLTINPTYNNSPIAASTCDNQPYTLPWGGTGVAGANVHTYPSVNNCDSVVTINLTINPTYNNSPIAASTCDNQPYTLPWGGTGVAGANVHTYKTVNNCDSTVTINLTINPTYNNSPIAASTCDNQPYTLPWGGTGVAGANVHTYKTVNNCDSVVTINLTINPTYNNSPIAASTCDNQPYILPWGGTGVAGANVHIYKTVNNCDSVVTINLTINPTYNNSPIAASTCDNQPYTLPWGGTGVAGANVHTYTSVRNCDSVVTINLTINSTYNNDPIPASTCDNQPYTLPWGGTGVAGANVHTYTSVNKCDSVVTINLTINPTYNNSPIAASTCDNQPYTLPWGGTGVAGANVHTYPSVNNCDSVVAINLTINPTYNNDPIPASTCDNQPYTLPWGGIGVVGANVHTYKTVNNCDSIVTINLTINPTYNNSPITASTCDNQLYTLPWGGTGVAGANVHTYPSVNNCDSVVTINLTINPTYNNSPITASTCDNQPYTLPWGGTGVAGANVHTYTSVNNCDSTVTINLTINPTYNNSPIAASTCDNQPYILPWGGTGVAGANVHTYKTLNNCDSTVTINLTINPTYNNSPIAASTCDNQPYILPWGGTGVAGANVHTYPSVNNCDSVVTINLTINPTYNNSPITASTCDNQLYTLPWGGTGVAGANVHTYPSVNNCDSVVTINLTINPTYNNSPITASTCDNQPYTLPWGGTGVAGANVHTYPSVNNCDSVVTINLTINPTYNNSPITASTCDNQPYTLPWGGTGVAGANVHTYPSVNNCDSVVTINLTINPTYNNSPISASTCDNQPYSLPWGGTGVAGANVHTYTSVSNCDSVVTINLTINPTYNNPPIPVSTCNNQPYTLPWGGTAVSGDNVHTYTSVSNCDSVVTINLTSNSFYQNPPIAASTCDNEPYTLPWGGIGVIGANVHTYTSINNCDSVVTINLTINPTYNNSPIAASTCDNQPYTLPWGGTGVAGANVHTYPSVNNCDSTVTINLTINPTYNNSPIAASTCDNQPYTLPWGGTGVAGANVHTYASVNNCDSIVTINLTINPTYNNSPITASTCDNQPYTLPWGGTGVAGANVHTYASVNNCDSVVTINLTINPTYNNSPIAASTCDNQPYTLPWGGTGVAGANVHTYASVNNCDSIVTINLTINPTYNNSPIAASTCDNQPYTLPWGGTGVAGANVHTYTSVNNCDSVVTINLTINPTYNNSPIAASTCDNQPYTLPWGGTGVAGANIHTYTSVNKCDSVVTINLTINPTYNNSPVAASTCGNQPYTLPWGGAGVAGANTHTYASVNNCDSVVTINLTINPTYNNSPIAASTCDNQPYTLPWGGTGVAGPNVHTYKTVNNCDSVVTINLTINPTYNNSPISASTCDNQPYSLPWGGTGVTGANVHTYKTVNNCDSVVTINLTINPTYNNPPIPVSTCNNQPYTLPWGSTAVSGDNVHTYTSVSNCDSVVTINLTSNSFYQNPPIAASTCDNEPYTLPWGGTGIAGANVHTYTSVNNCDSIVTINLTINPTYNNSPIAASTCDNEPYTLPWGGTGVAGANVHTYKSVSNCDSVVTIDLTINRTYNNSPIAASTCDNDPYILPWGGAGIAGANVHTYSSVHSCDSVVTINLTINKTYNTTGAPLNVCDNQTYPTLPWGGTAVAGANVHTYKSVSNCDSVVTVYLTVNTHPNVTINPNGSTSICQGGSVQLCASGANSYRWNTGETTPCINASANETYSVVGTGNTCTGTATQNVTVNSNPNVFLSPQAPASICQGSTIQLCASGADSYAWSNGATTPCITVGSGLSAGQSYPYSVVGKVSSTGCTGGAETSVSVNALPKVSITPNGSLSFCQGGSVQLCASGAATYKWSPGNQTISCISVTSGGTYSVVGTDGNQCTASASVGATLNQNPSVTVTPTNGTCKNGGLGSACANPSGGSGSGYSYIWSNTSTTPCISGLSASTYSVTIKDGNGCTASNSNTVSVNTAPPNANAGPNEAVGCASGTVQLSGSSTTSGATFSWATSGGGNIVSGANTATPTVNAAGTYTVTVTNSSTGCTATATTSVTSGGQTLNCNITVTTCLLNHQHCTCTLNHQHCNGPNCTLNHQHCQCTLNHTHCFYSTSTCQSNHQHCVCTLNHQHCNGPNCTLKHQHCYCGLNHQHCCTGYYNYDNSCNGEPETLTASGGTSYIWSTGATTASITVTKSGDYTVTVSNSSGCSSACSKMITIGAPPSCTISGNGSICSGGSTSLCAPQGSGLSYKWSTQATTQCINVSAGGTYSVTVTNSAGCSSMCNKCVTLSSAPSCSITTGCGGNRTCNGQGTSLCGPSNCGTGTTFSWNTGATTQCINVSKTGTYSLTVTNSSGCSSTCNETITIGTAPSCAITGNSILPCNGGSTTLSGPSGSGLSYSWNTGATASSITVSKTGTYYLTVTNSTGCSSTCNICVTEAAGPYCKISGNLMITKGGSTTLSAPSGYTYKWSNGLTTQSITVKSTGSYSVTVTNSSGCSCTCSVCVTMCGNRESSSPGDGSASNYGTINVSAYPNPFTSIATIEFQKNDEASHIRVEIYAIDGNKVAILFDGEVDAGVVYKAEFDAANLAEGIYIYKVISEDNVVNGKLLLMKH